MGDGRSPEQRRVSALPFLPGLMFLPASSFCLLQLLRAAGPGHLQSPCSGVGRLPPGGLAHGRKRNHWWQQEPAQKVLGRRPGQGTLMTPCHQSGLWDRPGGFWVGSSGELRPPCCGEGWDLLPSLPGNSLDSLRPGPAWHQPHGRSAATRHEASCAPRFLFRVQEAAR